MKKPFVSLLFLAIFVLNSNVNSQQVQTANKFSKILSDIETGGKQTYTEVSELFKLIEYAIMNTDSVVSLISKMETSDLDSVKKAIDVLTNDVLSVYTVINSNDSTYSKLLKNFKELVFDKTYALDDIIKGVSQDLAWHRNEKARLLHVEPKSKTINMQIGYEEKIIDQISLQVKYLQEAQKKLLRIQNQGSVTEDDIDFFLVACKKNEEFLRYTIQTLKIYHDVEQFLKDAGSLASIKEISKKMYLSLNDLNEQVLDLVKTKIEELEKESQKESTKKM